MMRFLLMVILSVTIMTSWASSPRYLFSNPRQQAQFQSLLHDLRCPVCQNQDLADSNAGVAVDLRQELYRRIIMNQSDKEIIDYLTVRYGDFILFKPPVRMTTAVLWFGPLLLLGLGLLFFGLTCIRRPQHD